MDVLKEIVPLAEITVTEQVVSHDGALLQLDTRVPGSNVGYLYIVKGANISVVERTVIIKIDYDDKDSEHVDYAEEIAVYKDGAWTKV